MNLAMLKPCPFCGGTNLSDERNDSVCWIRCLDCEALGPESDHSKEAAEFWNRRLG